VEVHGANGYLIDQFLQDVSNVRTDAYGGSPEKRSRFALEILDAVVSRVGERKTAIRLSPWNTYQSTCIVIFCSLLLSVFTVGMGMEDPLPTFGFLVSQLRLHHPNLAYIHVVEPRIDGASTEVVDFGGRSNDVLRNIWESGDGPNDRRLISAGGYTRALGIECADTKGDLIAYGRSFIANVRQPFDCFYPITKSLTLLLS
jgi:NADPH2 dehydrogenase